MEEAWFSVEVARNFRWLAFTAFLSFLAALPPGGRVRALLSAVWTIGIVTGVGALILGVIAMLVDQPAWVVRPLVAVGIAFTIAFGATFAQRHAAATRNTAVETV